MTIGLLINVLLAIYAYRRWKKGDRCTYFVILQFLIFQTYKLSILTQGVIRSDDLALVLVLLTYIQSCKKVRISNLIGRIVPVFVCFVIVGMIVSLLHKDLPLIQVIKGARPYFFILSIYDIWLMKKEEIKKTIYYIFLINIIFSLIFIIQTFFPVRLLLDSWEGGGIGRGGFLGLRRYYSFPPFIPFCCLYSCFLFPQNKKNKTLYIIISFATLLLIQSRGMLMYTALLVIAAFVLFKASPSKKMLYIALSFIIALVLDSAVLSGETGERTDNDLSKLISGSISTDERPEGDATMSLRIWMLLVRNERLLEGDLFDKIFGLGYFAQINTRQAENLNLEGIVVRYYSSDNFFMTTPDISYANILSYLGYGGTLLYIGILLSIFFFFYKYRRLGDYSQLGMLYMVYLLATGFNGSAISTPTCLLIPFLFMKLVDINFRTYKRERYKNILSIPIINK